ncbi:trifunctional enzyme subunit alpha, mitochondrial-like isoform X3 [Agrilus planipennis]|uniref:Trifunctional enzyme subunit alpha, mitochondrial-like isoform X2 n=1 Tax=Agrilus planipennis TaxID=224129 RepID=A0A1W4XJ74_AGRPL|nr:trifunctional enzyme subunit alpha, mitochondrial-like isoform X2 [Agrilus planipennis]XP_025830044.1 trifunctional enzyme subunit alpha, mitochondrial-like isoform X3 [Agrilus planipennis]
MSLQFRTLRQVIQKNRRAASVRFVSTHDLKHTKTKVVDNIAVITIDTPNAKVNSLGTEIMLEFDSILHKIKSDTSVQAAVLISGKPNCFIAGADISMLENCKTEEDATRIATIGQALLNEIETSSKPIVAAVQGSCLGGGLEVALSCHYRIGVNDKKTALV